MQRCSDGMETCDSLLLKKLFAIPLLKKFNHIFSPYERMFLYLITFVASDNTTLLYTFLATSFMILMVSFLLRNALFLNTGSKMYLQVCCRCQILPSDWSENVLNNVL